MDMSRLQTNWIWLPSWTPEDDSDARLVYFRKEFTVGDARPGQKKIRITADSRYKLYINGQFVQEGPQKPLDTKEWFVDTADIAPYLVQGVNIVAVEVLRFATGQNDSLYRSNTPCLYVEDCTQDAPALVGKTGWKCTVNREISIVGEAGRPAPIHAQENVSATDAFAGWKAPGYDAAQWQNAAPKLIFNIAMADAPFNLVPRTIPAMRSEARRFTAVAKGDDRFAALLQGAGSVTIPAHTTEIVEIAADAEECGYLLYAFAGGAGAVMTTLCSECYAYPQGTRPSPMGGVTQLPPKKGDRTDAASGQLFGHTSKYKVAGWGTADAPETYEPYWFRTFRYVQLKIETADAPLTITDFSYRATGYPLEVKTTGQTSDPIFAPIWDISVRTLARCMHETYMDCPFYEQLQYAMDSRSEILYTYAVSADDRLARQAMEAFRRSQRPDGLVHADAPTVKSNVIPAFSIYYLLMVHDHMMYFGDKALVRQHLPAIDGVLGFFDRNLTAQGLVGKIGGPILRHRYWSFIDWAGAWDSGVPGAYGKGGGSLTMESLLYLYGLQKAAELADFAGRADTAAEYRQRATVLSDAIRAHCFGRYNGTPLVQDGPGVEEYSVHCQVFAILTGLVDAAAGRQMLETTVGKDNIPQASVAFMFYLFRALERCGWYEKTDELWNVWRQMVNDHLTTCVENDTDARSDCHAWGSLLCYELPAVILGVQPAAPGFRAVRIAPQAGTLREASGDVITPHGAVHVEWQKDADNALHLHYTLPEGMTLAT